MAVAPHQAAAQTAAGSTRPAAKPAPKPAAAALPSSDYWSVNTSLPSQYTAERPRQQQQRTASTQRSASQGVQTEMTSEFGRMPVQGAAGSSIGFTSGQTASSGRFTDGREVPGINANTRSEDSYVGLSLTTRSASKGFIVPVPTPWGRTE
ncbi:MAG: hypothetical protein K2Z80_05690 [Xanthobacteraceae bacterium]|nr:hypothetical protein [Xanthobacteraceae bacterium]